MAQSTLQSLSQGTKNPRKQKLDAETSSAHGVPATPAVASLLCQSKPLLASQDAKIFLPRAWFGCPSLSLFPLCSPCFCPRFSWGHPGGWELLPRAGGAGGSQLGHCDISGVPDHSWHRSCSQNSPLVTAPLRGCPWNREFADQSHPPRPNSLPDRKHGAGWQQEGPDSTQPCSVAGEATSSQAPVSLCTKLPRGANPAQPGAHQSHQLGFTHIPDGMQLPRALCSHPGGCILLGLFYLPAETQTIRLQPPAAGPVPPRGFLEQGLARDQGTGDGSLWDPDGKTTSGRSCMLWD